MDSNNNENNSNRKKCPVCGRFAKAEAVDKHEKAVAALREALKECRDDIREKECTIDTMKANLSLYENENGKLSDKVEKQKKELADNEKTISDLELEAKALRAKLDVLKKRGLWARIINSDI